VGADVAGEGEDGVEVDLHDLVEVVVWELVAGVAALDAGAVDEDADLVAVGEDLGDQGGDAGGGAEVGGVDFRLAAELADLVSCGGDKFVTLGVLGELEGVLWGIWETDLDEEDVCAGLSEANGKGLTNATGAAGDEGSLALEGEEG
jgi:hypothetical protein